MQKKERESEAHRRHTKRLVSEIEMLKVVFCLVRITKNTSSIKFPEDINILTVTTVDSNSQLNDAYVRLYFSAHISATRKFFRSVRPLL
jgi:hypothetical protein